MMPCSSRGPCVPFQVRFPQMVRFGAALALVALLFTLQSPAHAARREPFSVIEATIADVRTALQKRRVTSREIVTQSLARIATYEDRLHATLYVNPHALEEADDRDRERRAGRIRGPLHGIPIALKDNIHTTNMPTTGGA